jgi:hypothetical protein
MKKLTSLIIATLCTVMTFTSCEEVEKSANNLVGTWRLSSTEIYYENGRIETKMPQNGEWEEYEFTQSVVKKTSNEVPYMIPAPYTVEGDNIVIGVGGIGLKLEIVTLTNNTLKIKDLEFEGGIDFKISTYKKI